MADRSRWDPYAENFVRGLTELAASFDERGHARVPQAYRTGDGFPLGPWVHRRRQERTAGRSTGQRISALDALGFVR